MESKSHLKTNHLIENDIKNTNSPTQCCQMNLKDGEKVDTELVGQNHIHYVEEHQADNAEVEQCIGVSVAAKGQCFLQSPKILETMQDVISELEGHNDIQTARTIEELQFISPVDENQTFSQDSCNVKGYQELGIEQERQNLLQSDKPVENHQDVAAELEQDNLKSLKNIKFQDVDGEKQGHNYLQTVMSMKEHQLVRTDNVGQDHLLDVMNVKLCRDVTIKLDIENSPKPSTLNHQWNDICEPFVSADICGANASEHTLVPNDSQKIIKLATNFMGNGNDMDMETDILLKPKQLLSFDDAALPFEPKNYSFSENKSSLHNKFSTNLECTFGANKTTGAVCSHLPLKDAYPISSLSNIASYSNLKSNFECFQTSEMEPRSNKTKHCISNPTITPLSNSIANQELKFCNEFNFHQIIINSLAFFKVKLPFISDNMAVTDEECKVMKKNSRSLSNPQISSTDILEVTREASGSSFHLPSFHIFNDDKDQTVQDYQEIAHFQAVNPAATLLVVPQKSSGAPAIFLKSDSPNSSPAGSPIRDPKFAFKKSLMNRDLEMDVLKNPECLEAEDIIHIPISRRSSFCSRMNLLKEKIRRPTLHNILPYPLSQLKEREETSLEKDRRHSTMSTLSITQTSRRPSLTSLLSISPSTAGRRFSFNICSRVSFSSF